MIVQVAKGENVTETESQSLGDLLKRELVALAIQAAVELAKELEGGGQIGKDIRRGFYGGQEIIDLITSRFNNLWTIFSVAGRRASFRVRGL